MRRQELEELFTVWQAKLLHPLDRSRWTNVLNTTVASLLSAQPLQCLTKVQVQVQFISIPAGVILFAASSIVCRYVGQHLVATYLILRRHSGVGGLFPVPAIPRLCFYRQRCASRKFKLFFLARDVPCRVRVDGSRL